ncbi:hypothetical protein M1M25_gp043 [Tenacibaculum phage Gundel_1]|uniref:Uncharacterized protein n=1 Tax=Tenacibaculum phage Gundel_1 TaxID=2745672 RepID=A0A8E4ZDY1_9CAUD|nr:hypothetical protein M1M25_gp043 [Tenacibaculum phage Gundel_1]QQV91476.1 hypothetical protein Gundel1_43 [Tenacibaculum phage Gundel_1]
MTPKDNARVITDKFYKIQITAGKTPDWDIAKKQAEFLCSEVIAVIPMYTRKLNPKWKLWNDTKEQLLKL